MIRNNASFYLIIATPIKKRRLIQKTQLFDDEIAFCSLKFISSLTRLKLFREKARR